MAEWYRSNPCANGHDTFNEAEPSPVQPAATEN